MTRIMRMIALTRFRVLTTLAELPLAFSARRSGWINSNGSKAHIASE
jgi:hypothetical protein